MLAAKKELIKLGKSIGIMECCFSFLPELGSG